MIGHGVCSCSSHSWAAGRTTSAANPWTQSRMSFWSWVSSSEKVTSWLAAPVIASTAASAACAPALVGGAPAGADIGRESPFRVQNTGPVAGNHRAGTAFAGHLLDLDRVPHEPAIHARSRVLGGPEARLRG